MSYEIQQIIVVINNYMEISTSFNKCAGKNYQEIFSKQSIYIYMHTSIFNSIYYYILSICFNQFKIIFIHQFLLV